MATVLVIREKSEKMVEMVREKSRNLRKKEEGCQGKVGES